MSDGLFEDKFDMERYINKRILEVQDLSQRKLLKQTLSRLFLNLYDHIEKEYDTLEERIFEEREQDIKRFTIMTSIIPREFFDETEEALVAMDESDKERRQIDTIEMLEAMKKKESFFLYPTLMEADYLVVAAAEKEERIFTGIIDTNMGQFRANFIIKKNTKYLRMIENLYLIFNSNHLPWITIFAPYLYKMFDVYLDSIESWEEEAEIEEIVIDFEKYKNYMKFDCIPVWNISTLIEKSSSYPEPCIDKVHYEHIIYRHRLEEDTDYMIGLMDIQLANIRRIKGDLVITCQEEYPVKWLLYKLGNKSLKKPIYPVFSNHILNDFSDSLSNSYKNTIKTKTEMERFITSLGYQHVIDFSGYELRNETVEASESYNLDYFIEDEFRTGTNRTTLILYFTPKETDYYINRDIMSYIVTQIQKLFPEYHCTGKIK